MAVQFTHHVVMTEDEKSMVEEMGRCGQVVMRDPKKPVSSSGRLVPERDADEFESDMPWVFNRRVSPRSESSLRSGPQGRSHP